MTLTTNWFIQLVAIAGQVINQYGGLIPPKYAPWVALAIGTLQSASAIVAHKSTPAGNAIKSTMAGETIEVKQ